MDIYQKYFSSEGIIIIKPLINAHCALPADGPQGKTISEIVELYGKPQRIETSGEQQKMIYPMAPNAYCELTITNGKCDEHVGMMVQTGGVPYRDMDD